MSKRLRLIVLLLVLGGIVGFLVVSRLDPVRYHLMLTEFRGFLESPEDEPDFGKLNGAIEHRDALVRSGALHEVDFALRPVDRSSPEFPDLLRVLEAEAQNGPFYELQWTYGNDVPAAIRLWFKPEDESRWRAALSPTSRSNSRPRLVSS